MATLTETFNEGDKVRIAMPIHGRYGRGVIEKILWHDVYVRLNYKNILVHRYLNELTKLRN